MRQLLLLLLVLSAQSVLATTFVFSPTGNDNAAGSAVAPWKSFGKFTKAISGVACTSNADCTGAGATCDLSIGFCRAIWPGDTVLFRPGRYAACEGLDYVYQGFDRGGGTAASPVTISVDTTCGAACATGNVEIHGGVTPGLCTGVGSTWNQAKKCVGTPFADAACDNDTDCVGGTCTDMSGVYWIQSTQDNNGQWYNGLDAGVAYQPSTTPGGAPKIFEILYAPDTPLLTMPTFNSGKAQMMPYGTLPPTTLQDQYPSIPGGAHQVTVVHTARYKQDIGVTTYCPNGGCSYPDNTPFVKVTGTPSITQYAVTTDGTYTFAAADVGVVVHIQYEYGNCIANRTPWLCCTGRGTGDSRCSSSRIYVQKESGATPSTADTGFGPVEFPFKPTLLWQTSTSGPPLQYMTWTNSNNGRLFFFWWALSGSLMLKNAQNITFEDFDMGYTSRVNTYAHSAVTGNANSSRFPRYNLGDTYQITGWPESRDGTGAILNVVRNIAFRRGKIHGSQGNEQIHFLGSDCADPAHAILCDASKQPTTHTNLLFENLEIGDGPFAVLNGSSGTALTPNANVSQAFKNWPPPGYTAWANVFDTHWGPLGGGTNTDGTFISSSNAHTIRNCYIHDGGLISFFESGGSGDLIFENNRVDLARMYYTDGSGAPGFHPNVLTSYCGAPTGCGGNEGRLALTVPTRFTFPNRHGAIIRNNLFLNTSANAIRTGIFKNYGGEPDPAFKPITPLLIVNNTFHVGPDFRQAVADPASCTLAMIWFWDALSPTGWTMTTTTGEKAQFKNNIVLRDPLSGCNSMITGGLPLLRIDVGQLNQIDLDYNNWGGQFGAWWVGNNRTGVYGPATTAGTYLNLVQAIPGGSANETHSLNANPQFVVPYSNVSIRTTTPISPSYQTGLDLHAISYGAFSTDYEGAARPNGAWSMGAFQGEATGTTVLASTTTTGTGTTSTTLAGTTTTTTTSTTLPGPVGMRGVGLYGVGRN